MAAPASAQEAFPSRPVEMTVNFGPGGGADRMERTLARLLEKELAVSVPVATAGFGALDDIAVVYFCLAFGILSYFMKRFGIPTAPFILAVILGPWPSATS